MEQNNSQSKALKPSAHSLETDDLLKVLEGQEIQDIVPIPFENDILHFITTFNIEPGTEKIKQHTLYQIYKVWSQQPLKKLEFHSKIAQYFENTKIGTNRAWFVNQNAIKLTHDAYKYFSNDNHRLRSKPWAKHFENFLKFHSLTKGEFYIDERILFFIYDKFTHATGLDNFKNQTLSKSNFSIYCKIYLPEKITKHGKLYGVSNNIQQFFQVGQLARMKEMYEKEEKKSEKPKRRTRPKSKSKPKKTV